MENARLFYLISLLPAAFFVYLSIGNIIHSFDEFRLKEFFLYFKITIVPWFKVIKSKRVYSEYGRFFLTITKKGKPLLIRDRFFVYEWISEFNYYTSYTSKEELIKSIEKTLDTYKKSNNDEIDKWVNDMKSWDGYTSDTLRRDKKISKLVN